jgi:hypothetical protein
MACMACENDPRHHTAVRTCGCQCIASFCLWPLVRDKAGSVEVQHSLAFGNAGLLAVVLHQRQKGCKSVIVPAMKSLFRGGDVGWRCCGVQRGRKRPHDYFRDRADALPEALAWLNLQSGVIFVRAPLRGVPAS